MPGRSCPRFRARSTWNGSGGHGKRKLLPLANVAGAPLAIEAVRRIDVIFEQELEINGDPAERRLARRKDVLAPIVGGLELWMRAERSRLSTLNVVDRMMDSTLKR